jgi:phage terminase large subunit-like protein
MTRVVTVTPAVTTMRIVVTEDGWTLSDEVVCGTPRECLAAAVSTYHAFGADHVAGVANNGGDLIGLLLNQIDPAVPYRKVILTR